jgi:hypothetical protein
VVPRGLDVESAGVVSSMVYSFQRVEEQHRYFKKSMKN